MKLFLLLTALATMTLSNTECNNNKYSSKKFRGRLAIKGICYNYTIKLLKGTIDTSVISTEWKDPYTQKIHTNVFALADPCTFPVSINEGDEFDFELDISDSSPCIVCEAYYPTPSRSLKIKVLNK